MDKRISLQVELEGLAGRNVYFQPPASVQLVYPCVIYNLSAGDAKRADDSVYTYTNRFELIFIYRKPNIEIIEHRVDKVREKIIGSLYLCRYSYS